MCLLYRVKSYTEVCCNWQDSSDSGGRVAWESEDSGFDPPFSSWLHVWSLVTSIYRHQPGPWLPPPSVWIALEEGTTVYKYTIYNTCPWLLWFLVSYECLFFVGHRLFLVKWFIFKWLKGFVLWIDLPNIELTREHSGVCLKHFSTRLLLEESFIIVWLIVNPWDWFKVSLQPSQPVCPQGLQRTSHPFLWRGWRLS